MKIVKKVKYEEWNSDRIIGRNKVKIAILHLIWNLIRSDRNFPLVVLGRIEETSKLSDVRNDFRPELATISRIRDAKFTIVGTVWRYQFNISAIPLAPLIRQKPSDKGATCLLEIYYRRT